MGERGKRWIKGFKSVEIGENKEEGRYLYAKNDIGKGDVILMQQPYIWCINEEFKEDCCRFCISTINTKFVCCKLCSQVIYCSTECQKFDAAEHFTLECRLLYEIFTKNKNESFPPELIPEMKLLIRLLSRKRAEIIAIKNNKNNDEKEDNFDCFLPLTWETQKNYEDYQQLVSNPDDYPSQFMESVKYWIISYISQLLSYFKQLKNTDDKAEEEKELIEIICRNRRNTFSYGNGDESDPQASGIYLLPSLFNHSCEPNVIIRIFSSSEQLNYKTENGKSIGPVLSFIAARNIKSGDKLLISYLDNGMSPSFSDDLSDEDDNNDDDEDDPMNNYMMRRRELLQNYLFLCKCSKCLRQSAAAKNNINNNNKKKEEKIREIENNEITDKKEESNGEKEEEKKEEFLNEDKEILERESNYNSSEDTNNNIEGDNENTLNNNKTLIENNEDQNNNNEGKNEEENKEGEEEEGEEGEKEEGEEEEGEEEEFPTPKLIGQVFVVNLGGKRARFKVMGFTIKLEEESGELISILQIRILTSQDPSKIHQIPYTDFLSAISDTN